MEYVKMNIFAMRLFLWSGVVLVVALFVAQGWLMGFIPGPSPALSPQETAQIFIKGKNSIQVGALLQMVCWSFYSTWATPIIMFIRKTEKEMPIFTFVSVIITGGSWLIYLFVPMTWSVIAFRAETLDPQTIQVMNDWVWYVWLYTWPPFSMWMFIIGAAILLDKTVPTVYPRWVGYFNLWSGFLVVPAGMIAFFKEGPFAYNGMVSFWEAGGVFFGWIVVMTIVTFKVVRKQEVLQSSEVFLAGRRKWRLAMGLNAE